ncbi:Putative amino-acid ABC transporter-binding protein YhdW [Seminavis robusta]|uniref:Amino-acid ABC transporter-binding protein YhdW n=1 Tax=Seminavis robusta TaxID=568900 RepID=A0A9N8DZA5_9STRA|nr:Putative amino-acid ABC transporter-binding protein YhdW [Seminavis robusta]|eukprot:Sro465_g148620.1 Putative amino-acid ABC transporter-binding protein YhdW (826) ;mRNA; f:40266-42917
MSDNPSNKLKGSGEEHGTTGRTEYSSSEQERAANTPVVAEGTQKDEAFKTLVNILDQKVQENTKPVAISNTDARNETRGENDDTVLEVARSEVELPSRMLTEAAPGAYAVPGRLSTAASSGNELPGDEAAAPNPTADNPNSTTTVTAFLSPAENQNRTNGGSHHQTVGELVVHASPDDDDNRNQENAKKRKVVAFVGVLLLLAVIVVIVMALAGAFGSKTDDESGKAESGTANGSSNLADVNDTAVDIANNLRFSKTLRKIKSEGILHCPFMPIAGYMFANSTTGDADGIHTVMCRAIGSAIFGADRLPSGFSGRNKLWTVNATVGTMFEEKYKDFNETFPRIEWVDLTPVRTGRGLSQIFTGIGYTMERHTYEHFLKFGLSFTQPYSFEGAYISGNPFFVECFVDKGFKHTQECKDLSICTNMGSSYYTFLSRVIPDRRIHKIQFYTDAYPMFVNASCNLIIHSAGERARDVVLNQYGYKGNFTTSGAVFNKEPIGLGTFKGDPVWDDFVNAVVQSLVSAELHGITKATARLFPQTDVFGEDFRDMFRNAIGAVGNFAEIYEEHLQEAIPREAVNTINNGNAGLLFAAPLGTQKLWSNFTLGHNIQRVLERGRLFCGVRLGRPGFATGKNDNGTVPTFAGMDVDFCRAVAASMFGGDTEAVDYIELNSSDPSDGYVKLAAGGVDVVAGATWNLANDVKEPGTGIGFAFSQPYFYGYGEEEDNLCLASMQDDQVWSTYLYWVVGCTIYAEQEGIGQTNSTKMPLIYAFGEGFQRMFRDIVLAVGNYKEMYSRNIEPTIPRSVHRRNSLNYGSSSGPQLYPMPGFM